MMRRFSCVLYIVVLFISCSLNAEQPAIVTPDADTNTVPALKSSNKPHSLKVGTPKIIHVVTAEEQTALAERNAEEDKIEDNPYSLILYQPSYILPFYYTGSPDTNAYANLTPDNQTLMTSEFKGQLSIKVPVVKDFFSPKNSLDIAYTQLSYWQVYAASQYFRETDYSPEVFFERLENDNLAWKVGMLHQSNGRGGTDERSWNRLYGELIFSDTSWVVHIQPWTLIFQNESSDIHNPDIEHYLGYGQVTFALKVNDNTFSLHVQNLLESSFTRGNTEVDWSFPLHGHFRGYIQYFNGYGQSLIEYNHYTNSAGIGIAFNDWI